MKKTDLIKKISNGEDSYTQFKVDITNANKLAGELVAFSNARGGLLIIGVDDKGNVVGLENEDIRRLNQLIGNVINSHVVPPIYPLVKIENIEDKKIILVEIDEGSNKPYSTNAGVYLTKAGSDKRKISPQELRRLFAQSKELYADEEILPKTDITDINSELFMQFLKRDNEKIYEDVKLRKLSFSKTLENRELLRNGHLTLAGNLIFGLEPQQFCPLFYVDCCYFNGLDVSVNSYISEKRFKGTFLNMLNGAVGFVVSQLRSYQVEDDFNSSGKLEISERVLTELVVNALIHRDYYINSSIKVFMFHDRIEIISPGKLTNSLTVEKIKSGISITRNPILASICKNILPYSGYGSGIKRVLEIDPTVEFINDIEKEEFKCIILRKLKEI
jgi:predicted HTH transcriptional regulator